MTNNKNKVIINTMIHVYVPDFASSGTDTGAKAGISVYVF